MRRFAMFAFLLPVFAVGSVRAESALPVEMLAEIKDASVFVRVTKEKIVEASGSGFLVRVDGDTGYIVTNHHVVNLTVLLERKIAVPVGPSRIVPRPGPKLGPKPRPKPGIPPRPTTAPTIEYRTVIVEVAIPAPDITLVFGSGTKQERTVPAEVVASDPDLDLAVLKVTGVKNLPKPLNLKSGELRETMPLFVFGFPFGKGLAIGKDANPAITVNRAFVSSIRTDPNGDVKTVQVDGSINPGNSGGPLVDDKGQLAGIAVVRIRNTTIGLAIPSADLHRVLAGFAARPKLVSAKAEKDTLEVQVEVGVVDPFQTVKSVSLYYAPTSALTDAAKKDGLAKLAECKKVDLKRDKLKAAGTFSLPVSDNAFDLTCQVAYVNGDGKTILGPLKEGALNVPAPKGAMAKVEVKQPDPPTTTPPAKD